MKTYRTQVVAAPWGAAQPHKWRTREAASVADAARQAAAPLVIRPGARLTVLVVDVLNGEEFHRVELEGR